MNNNTISNKINGLSIRSKLILLLMVPVLGLVYFAVHGILDHLQIMRDVSATSQLMKLSVRTGSLFHELQRERGFSSGYINAGGNKFREDLSRQRERSDAEFKKLAEAVAANPDSAAMVKTSMDAVSALHEKLQDTRARIDSLTIENRDAYAFYTDINSACLDVLASVASHSMHPDMMRAAFSYYAFSKAKEEVGKERATLNAVLAADRFNDETYTRMFAIIASQRNYLEEFRKYGSPATLSIFDDAAKSEQFRKAEGLRAAILARGMAGKFGITPEVWYDTISAKIDMMKMVEDRLSREILDRADELSVDTKQTLMLSLTLTALMGVLVVVLSRMVVNSINRPLVVLVKALEGIEHGKFNQIGHLDNSHREDEIGNLMQGFDRMVVQLKESLEQRQAAENRVRDTLESTVRAVSEYQRFVAEVSGGDLKQRVELAGDSTGTLGQLGADLNSMTESLAHVASGTTEAVNTIYSALEELQSSINSQSAGASEQAAAVNQTTASLDEIKAMSAQTMEKVQMLGETAERSRRESEQGSAAVAQAIAGMASIRERVESIAQTILALSEQTQQIGEITAVVTNLAQQSKMLALNASIEAAKAGDAGKGFAVVAAEVRELAEQSQQSTAQVQKILQDIRHATDRAVMATEEGSKGVDAGMLSVQKSGEVMGRLGEVVRETAMASQQITAVVRQGFVGLEQVTSAMKEINKVTSQFVSSVQQSKESSAGLRRVAERLRETVSVYKL